MNRLRALGWTLLAVAALPIGFALLLGLPLGMLALLAFLFGELELTLFVPGFALYIFLFCVPAGFIHWRRRTDGKSSAPLRLPSVALLGLAAALSVGVGQAMLVMHSRPLFWVCFVLAAALPPIAALGLASQRLPGATTWRRAMAGWLSGSLLSTHLTILLGGAVSILAYLLVLPLRELIATAFASPSLERLFYSPALVLLIVEVAVVAPLVEELTKPLGAVLLGSRLRTPAEAFLVGMAGGVGFAIVENMLYEASGARVWAGIALMRGVGGVLHPLNAGLVALGWYGVRQGRPGAWRRLLGLYGLAVGVHALWNGGLAILFSGLGAYFFATDTWKVSIYGLGQPGAVVAFLLLEALVLWRLLFVVVGRLRDPDQPAVETALALHLERPRRLALWASGLMLVVVPIGALYGPLLARYADRLLPVGR